MTSNLLMICWMPQYSARSGSGFDWKDPDHFRIVMLPQADILSDAIRRMGTFLDGYKQK